VVKSVIQLETEEYDDPGQIDPDEEDWNENEGAVEYMYLREPSHV
jgi:hypothetical protein